MRCLSIADSLRDICKEAIFVCADKNLKKLITQRGYNVCILETDYRYPEQELDVFLSKEEFNASEGIVIDSYYVTSKYMEVLSKEKKVVFIDDYCNKFHLAALINYNIYADKKAYNDIYRSDKTQLILGPSYAPLRKEFENCKSPVIKEKAKSILILTGGADPFHIAYNLVKEIKKKKNQSLVYHFVVGELSSDYEKIKKLEDNTNIIIHHKVDNMKELMSSSDMAVSAAGSTLYELCACGIPTITYTFADNQMAGAKSFSEKGIMKNIGDIRVLTDFYTELTDSIDKLADSKAERKRMSEAASQLVDGFGAQRLAKKLKEIFSE